MMYRIAREGYPALMIAPLGEVPEINIAQEQPCSQESSNEPILSGYEN